MAFNIVELAADADECAFDQPCKFGHRVEGHAVYCQNDSWTDGPRKCRRTWYSGGEIKDEDCPGFQANPSFKGTLSPTPVFGAVCKKCSGKRLVQPNPDKESFDTCGLCQGSGVQPESVTLTRDELLLLESLIGPRYSDPWEEPHAIIVGDACRLKEMPDRPVDEKWVDYNSVAFDGGVSVYLTRITEKGFAILKMHWEHERAKRPAKPETNQ